MLNLDSLENNNAAILSWGDALTEDADLLIYGCDLTATAEGEQLVDSLAQITGADVAASDDLTGHKDLGGDWELEYDSGSIESKVAISVETQQNWTGLLADTTTGLVGHWSFDIDAHDSSGNNNDGTLTNDASIDTTLATNQIGIGKLALDGDGDTVDLTNHISDFSGLTEGTI